ncbi:serine hydrolase [Kurthia massiliensis]|uniref:serine hydrolase n=1 Tax=Kurthia massiliensis TaxID=1033739 RepID=UPI0002886A4D|nr:serine hydrolase [Kurthia massiliensis]
MLLIIGAIVFVILFAMMGLMTLSQKKLLTPESVLQFAKSNRNKVSLTVHQNGKGIGAINALQPFPLVNTSHLIIAVEYATQAAAGKIDATQKVNFDDIEKFHIPKLEGDQHREWVAQMKRARHKKDVPLQEVVHGMLRYNSFANAEYLMYVLGIANINECLRKLKMSKHDPIYPMASALYIADQQIDIIDYRKQANAIHQAMMETPKTQPERATARKHSTLKTWAERLPKSTTKDYVSLVKKINNQNFFDKEVYHYLTPVLEDMIIVQNTKDFITHGGQFLSLTASAVNAVMYFTDKSGNRIELAVFLQNLTPQEQMKLSMSMPNFFSQIVKDPVFRKRIEMQAKD